MQLKAKCPSQGWWFLKKKRAIQCPMPFIGMMNPQFQVVASGNSPALGIARGYPKEAGNKGFQMALKTKGSLVRVWEQRTPQVKMGLKTKGFRNSRLDDTNKCPTTKGSLRNCISIDVCISCNKARYLETLKFAEKCITLRNIQIPLGK